jgi:quinol monooxygenase YgiN
MRPVPDEIELTVVTLEFLTNSPAELLGVLSKYIVLTRNEPGCRNVDLVASVTKPGRYLVIQKWDSPDSQAAHFNSSVMVEMAESCRGLLTGPPTIDLYDAVTAHDLR